MRSFRRNCRRATVPGFFRSAFSSASMKSGTSFGFAKFFFDSHNSFSPGMVNGTPSFVPM